MLRRLVISKQNYMQLALIVLGSFSGLAIILFSVRLYGDIDFILGEKRDALSSSFIVVNKPVSMLNTLSGTRPEFRLDELEQIKKIEGVKKIAELKAGSFISKAGFEFGAQGMLTDMFFESVPADFLELPSGEWQWQAGESLPIVVPSDYLNLYNFGFAPGQNLPQISRSTATLAGLTVRVGNRDSFVTVPAHIAGFTDRINSILVPESFITFGNQYYRVSEDKGASRVVLMCEDIHSAELTDFIKRNRLETNMEMLKSGRISSLLNLILSIVLSIGLLVIVLSVLGFFQYSQLLLIQSSYEIQVLLKLGYTYTRLSTFFIQYYSIILTIIFSLAFLVYGIGYSMVSEFISNRGYQIEEGMNTNVIWVATGLSVLYLLILSMQSIFKIMQFSKPQK